MLSMGITLTPADFVEVTKEPSSVLMQFTLCYAMMPTLAFGLGKLFGLEAGLLAYSHSSPPHPLLTWNPCNGTTTSAMAHIYKFTCE